MTDRASIKGRFLIEGILCLTSPLIIGTGEKQELDLVVIKDSFGNPFIPATSLVGALRHYFYERLTLEGDDDQFEFFWGSDKRMSQRDSSYYQSAFSLDDLVALGTPLLSARDGICIDPLTGTARDAMKYDFEVVDPETEFKFRAQVTLREGFCRNTFLRIIVSIIKILAEGKLSLGAMTTKGFGKCKLKHYGVYEYNFSNKRDVFAWLKRETLDEQKMTLDFDLAFAEKEGSMFLEAIFGIKNSLIIKSYSGDPDSADAVHLKSRGKNVLPGTSIKGALRARAIKIINTLVGSSDTVKNPGDSPYSFGEIMTRSLFGWATDEPDEKREKIKSRFLVEETYINNVVEEIQFRTCIDRFTGGVVKAALFDTQPLWPQKQGEQVRIKIEIRDYEEWEAGLLLLLLKDLWTGDLPLGGDKGIGRGLLQGIWARIDMGKQKIYEIRVNGALDTGEKQYSLTIKGQEEMETLLQAFLEKVEKEMKEGTIVGRAETNKG